MAAEAARIKSEEEAAAAAAAEEALIKAVEAKKVAADADAKCNKLQRRIRKRRLHASICKGCSGCRRSTDFTAEGEAAAAAEEAAAVAAAEEARIKAEEEERSAAAAEAAHIQAEEDAVAAAAVEVYCRRYFSPRANEPTTLAVEGGPARNAAVQRAAQRAPLLAPPLPWEADVAPLSHALPERECFHELLCEQAAEFSDDDDDE